MDALQKLLRLRYCGWEWTSDVFYGLGYGESPRTDPLVIGGRLRASRPEIDLMPRKGNAADRRRAMIMRDGVIATDEFVAWYSGLDDAGSDDVDAAVGVLEHAGVKLGFPRSSAIEGVNFALRELRIQSNGRPLRVFYAFDPKNARPSCSSAVTRPGTSASTRP